MDQARLVESARRGDHEAFALLVRPLAGRLDRAARMILRDPELARDAVQEALIRAWRDLPGLREPERFEAWMLRLGVHACRDVERHRRRRVIEVELDAGDHPPDRNESEQVADRELLDAALRQLDPERRAIVVAHVMLGMPLPEVAAALGIPLGTAKSRLNRSLRSMRAAVVDEPVVVDVEGRPA